MAACNATTNAGHPCRAPALPDRPFCFHHDPERAKERHEAKVRGGLSMHHGKAGRDRPDVSLSTAHDVVQLLETAAADLLSQKPSTTRAKGLVYVASVARQAVETADLAERIEALEARLQPRISR